MFSCDESELTPERGFHKCVDYPHLPQHRYYEGYFHTLAGTAGSVESMNPRLGVPIDKPAAPVALRALVECVRRELAPALARALAAAGDGELARDFGSLVARGRHLADLAVQIHAGAPVRAHDVGWHTDGPNSLLHLALSIRGARALHARRTPTEDGAIGESVAWQRAGATYLSSPAAFEHGVEYPRAWRWRNRIIAVQVRFLLEDGYRTLGGDDFHELMSALAPALASVELRMPTLAKLRAMEAELRKGDGMGAAEAG